MSIKFRTYHLENIHQHLFKSNNTPDSFLKYYFKDNKSLGSKDRKFVTEIIYTSLRLNSYLNEHYSKKHHIQITIFLLKTFPEYFVSPKSQNYDFLDKIDTKDLFEVYSDLSESHNDIKTHFIQAYESDNMAQLFLSAFYQNSLNMSFSEQNKLAKSFLLSSNVNFWINKESDFVHNELSAISDYSECSYIANSYTLHKRANILNSDSFKKGLIDIQEEASQIVCHLLAPKEYETILDACAGAGGKSLLLAHLNPKAKITASDNSIQKLNELGKRKNRLKLSNIKIITNADENNIKLHHQYYDKILIDAPCSGSGTFRKNPLICDSLSQDDLANFAEKQLGLLNTYSKFLKKGGTLLYATCSIFNIENSQVIKSFLRANPEYKSTPLNSLIHNNDINDLSKKLSLKASDTHFNLYPHIHGTDGFFIASITHK